MSDSTVRSVAVRFSAETTAYLAKVRAAGAETEAVSDRMTKRVAANSALQEKALKAVGTTAKYGLGLAAFGFAAAVKESADFSEKMALVQTLSHANEMQMNRLSQAALNVGTNIGYSAKAVADGEAEMIKAGISVRDILQGGLKGALDLAAAGQLDLGQATEIAASAMTQFKLKGKDVPHIADLLAAGADKALGSVQDLGEGLKQVGTTSHQMGFSIEETVGTLAEFAQAGLIGERGGTTLKQMFLQLAAPTKKAQQLMDMYGISLYKANGQVKSMPQLAGNLQKSLEHLTPAQRNYALGVIFGSRAIQGANILLKDGAKVNAEWIAKVNDQGFAAQQASGKLNSLKGDIQKFEASVQSAFIELGSGTQSPLREFVQNTTSEIQKVTKNGDLQKWGQEISDDLVTAAHDAEPFAKAVGGTLKGLAKDGQAIADAFNSLPGGVQKALVTGGLLAYGANKIGVLKPLINTAKTLTGKGGAAGVGGVVSKAGVVPVYVTNKGFGDGDGLPGAGKGDKAGSEAETKLPPLLAASPYLLPLLTSGDAGPTYRSSQGKRDQSAQAFLETKHGYGSNKDSALAALIGKDPEKGIALLKQMSDIAGRSLPKELKYLGDAYPKTKAAADAYTKSITNQAGLTNLLLVPGLKDHAKALKSLPADVVTKVETPGAIQSAWDIADLKRKYDLTPKQVRTLVKLSGVPQAMSAVTALKRLMSQLHDENIHIRVTKTTNANLAEANVARADGGEIPGQRSPYGDKVLMWGAPGEEVISNRHGEADRFRAHRRAGLIPAYAAGGTVGGSTPKTTSKKAKPVLTRAEYHDALSSLIDGLISDMGIGPTGPAADVRAAFKDFAEQIRQDGGKVGKNFGILEDRLAKTAVALDKQRTALTNLQSSLDDLNQQAASLSASVAAGFQTDVFSSSYSPFADSDAAATANGGTAPTHTQADILGAGLQQVLTDAMNATQFASDIEDLKSKGFSGAGLTALSNSNNLAAADALDQMTPGQLSAYNQAFNVRAKATSTAGQVVSNAVFGDGITRLETAITGTTARIDHLEGAVNAILNTPQMDKLATKIGSKTAGAIKGVATKSANKAGG